MNSEQNEFVVKVGCWTITVMIQQLRYHVLSVTRDPFNKD